MERRVRVQSIRWSHNPFFYVAHGISRLTGDNYEFYVINLLVERSPTEADALSCNMTFSIPYARVDIRDCSTSTPGYEIFYANFTFKDIGLKSAE